MKYFVSLDIHDVLLREQKAQVKKKAEQQTLIIFPDNRSRYNMLSEAQLNHSEVINLVSTDTQNRKDIHRRNIKKGAGGAIIATQSEVFQPFCNLKKILFVDPHKWYYNNQQDPRYSLTTVVQQMSEIYGAPVEKIQNERSLAFPQ
jgi:primosomal protein N'